MKKTDKTAKKTINSITLTLDEIRQLIADTKAGNSDAASSLVAGKIREKAKRLKAQREKRRLRKEQQAGSTNSNHTTTPNRPRSSAVALSKPLAKAILWLHNRRDHIHSVIAQLHSHIPALSGTPLAESINTLLNLAAKASTSAQLYLHASPQDRPTHCLLGV